jgi:hypothetical protein
MNTVKRIFLRRSGILNALTNAFSMVLQPSTGRAGPVSLQALHDLN